MISRNKTSLAMLVVAVAILFGAIGFKFWWLNAATGEAAPSIGGPFALTDQNGTVRHDTDFHGKLALVYFGYTYCPDACPTALHAMSEALDQLGDKQTDVQPIFITIDPARDTQAQLKLYVANFHPRLIALTGTPEQIAAVAKEYHVYYQKVDQGGGDDYLMDHSSIIYLMGRDGRYVAHFRSTDTPAAMAAGLERFL